MGMSEFDLTNIFGLNFSSLPGFWRSRNRHSISYLIYSELPTVFMHISADLEMQVLDVQIPNKMYTQYKISKFL